MAHQVKRAKGSPPAELSGPRLDMLYGCVPLIRRNVFRISGDGTWLHLTEDGWEALPDPATVAAITSPGVD